MKKELAEKLYNDFPKIFAQKDLPPKKSAMYWGIDCGDGWFDLIYNLCSEIQEYCDKNTELDQVEAIQVKQKFGGLRFYIVGGDENVHKTVNQYEEKSYETCESCGSKNSVELHIIDGWMQTLCDKCWSGGAERGYN